MSRFPAVSPLPLLLLLCGPSTRLLADSLPNLPAPQNVRICSYNLIQVLYWDPVSVENGIGKVTYEVEFQAYGTKDWYKMKCSKITETQCNFTNAFPNTWRIFLRVRTVNNQLESEWVNTTDFQASRDTTVGPPTSVKVTSDFGLLIVAFSPPFDKISELNYYVYYWKNNAEKKVKATRSTSVKLNDLDPWTEYCLQVFAEYTTGEKNGTLSEPVCNRTTVKAEVMAIYTAKILFSVIFAIFALGVVCFILKQRFYENFKHWISPPFNLPAHIEEYLIEPTECVILAVLEKGSFIEDHCDTLSIISRE
uniref:Interferon gamma receptor 2 n=1 Tax=Geotrypetes seraphini TaxID=260995 RepID=A0A6P8RKD9_GEOSA|nr:interferon gamma receptor 2 [Geotrypetes seraphini]XP_033805117.1 interferon gamma receptor 2 [Geotrypetes seraphini]